MRRHRPAGNRRRAGNAQIEFALCGVFVVFLLISIADMARGLWINHTLAEAVRDGTRYAITRGDRYRDKDAPYGRLADARLQDVVRAVWRSAIGLERGRLNLRFEGPPGAVIKCEPSTACENITDFWPPDGSAAKNIEIAISATYPYNSLVVMYFPGTSPVQFGNYILGSTARERIVF